MIPKLFKMSTWGDLKEKNYYNCLDDVISLQFGKCFEVEDCSQIYLNWWDLIKRLISVTYTF